MILRCPGPPRSRTHAELPKIYRNSRNSTINLLFQILMNFGETWGIPSTLKDLGQKGCPESLDFHRKYNHLSTWPPKYPTLLKYTKIIKFPHSCWNFTKKSSKARKCILLKIWADSDDPRADFPLQNLCNSLGISRAGQVSCVPWGAGTDFRNFSAFTEIIGIYIK